MLRAVARLDGVSFPSLTKLGARWLRGRDAYVPRRKRGQRATPEATGADAISLAARQIAETLKLSAIVTYTSSGTTGLRASRERPEVPIIALSPIVQPPSTIVTAPVMYRAPSEARNATTLAISSGWPKRPSSVLPTTAE